MNRTPRRQGRTAPCARRPAEALIGAAALALSLLAGCGSGGAGTDGAEQEPQTSAQAAATSSPTGSASPEKDAFVERLYGSGIAGLPGSVEDTLWAIAQRVCALRADGAPRADMLAAVRPVAGAVASVAPGTSAEEIPGVVADSAIAANCP